MTADAFLRAILDDPADDAPRLLFADWSEERGDVARAEFIRLQCTLAGMAEDNPDRWALLARERDLVGRHGKGWASHRLRRLVKRYGFRRGFVEAVTLSAEDFLRRGEELFRLAPVRQVRLLNAADHVAELAAFPLLSRLTGLDLRHTKGLDVERARPLLHSRFLAGLRSLCLRGTGLCNGFGLLALANCPPLASLSALDLNDHRANATLGRRDLLQGQDYYQFQDWRLSDRAAPITAAAMQALVESQSLAGLRRLALGGYGQALHREVLDCLLGSRLLAGLTALDLSLNFVGAGHSGGDTYQGQPDLFELLGRSPAAAGLRTLRLGRVGTFYQPWGVLASKSHLSGLTILELEDAFPSPGWLKALANGAFPALVTLRLRGSRLIDWEGDSGETLATCLAAAVGLSRLAVLDLHQTAFGPKATHALAEGPLLAGLRWLSLANRSGYGTTPIGTEAVQELARSPQAAGLVHLDLSNNALTDDAAQALGGSPHLSGLLSLNVWHNQIGDAGVTALGSLAGLALLDLRANPLSLAACQWLRERFGSGVRYGPGRLLTDDRGNRIVGQQPPPPGAEYDAGVDQEEIPF